MTVLSYLRFALRPTAPRDGFERDMHAMLELARTQPGFQWAEMGATMTDPDVYVVVSEWDEVEQVRAWEHVEEHEGVMERWEPHYREPLLHRRFVPWVRPRPRPDAAAETSPEPGAAAETPPEPERPAGPELGSHPGA
jgi:heme-degrading monooxygenase HmoA